MPSGRRSTQRRTSAWALNTVNEPTETFSVSLSGAVNATIADATGVGTVLDNDTTPALSISDVSVTEGNTGMVNAVFTVTLSVVGSQTVTVNYATVNGTAIAPADYTAKSGTLSFAAGATTETITVAVAGDTLDEADDTFSVNLSGPVNATIADAAGTGTIIDDDAAPTLTIANASTTEGNAGTKKLTFTLTLSKASGRSLSVAYATANGSAVAGSDYSALSGTVVFAAGTVSRTIAVDILGDTIREPNETFVVNLSLPVNVILGVTQATGTILNND